MPLRRLVPTAVAALVLGAAGSSYALVAPQGHHRPAGAHHGAAAGQAGDLLRGAYAASYDRLSVSTPSVTVRVAPVVTGSPEVGETLRATPGTWRPREVKVRYQWLLGGRVVPDATGPTYTPGARAVGQRVAVVVVARRSGYTAGSAVSESTRRVQPGTIDLREVPEISGRAAVGRRLSVSEGSWSPRGVELTYQWFRGRTAIPRATRPEYRVVRADRGVRLRVVVSASRPGYDDATASARTAPVD
ncbi:hypothetical protein [Nocardioides rubriscoriae]|uniref:hypothetical protein n=1 Tax=Nocardioides rubriscoriae TaxID=642762 RepID=UPI0011E00021|nr:hypothetical protein [Nocardioides rubriscoriae]